MFDSLVAGLIIGFAVGTPLLVSARVALGVLGSTAAGVAPFVIVNGLEAFQKSLDALIASMTSNPRLILGLACGVALASLVSAGLRRLRDGD
jgi:hypothetical protein